MKKLQDRINNIDYYINKYTDFKEYKYIPVHKLNYLKEHFIDCCKKLTMENIDEMFNVVITEVMCNNYTVYLCFKFKKLFIAITDFSDIYETHMIETLLLCILGFEEYVPNDIKLYSCQPWFDDNRDRMKALEKIYKTYE